MASLPAAERYGPLLAVAISDELPPTAAVYQLRRSPTQVQEPLSLRAPGVLVVRDRLPCREVESPTRVERHKMPIAEVTIVEVSVVLPEGNGLLYRRTLVRAPVGIHAVIGEEGLYPAVPTAGYRLLVDAEVIVVNMNVLRLPAAVFIVRADFNPSWDAVLQGNTRVHLCTVSVTGITRRIAEPIRALP